MPVPPMLRLSVAVRRLIMPTPYTEYGELYICWACAVQGAAVSSNARSRSDFIFFSGSIMRQTTGAVHHGTKNCDNREELNYEYRHCPDVFIARLNASKKACMTAVFTHPRIPKSGRHNRRPYLLLFTKQPGHRSFASGFVRLAHAELDLW